MRAAGGRLQGAGGAQRQVIGRQRRAKVFAAQAAASAPLDVQGVAPVDEREGRLQQVVAVRAAARDVQKQIELGRRGQVV